MILSEQALRLRMKRQHLLVPAAADEYDDLYRDLSPGQNVYWCGFGDPPSLSFRADFDDKEYNRERQLRRELVKGRFQGGNLGWIEREDLELFAGLYRKPLDAPTEAQSKLLELITDNGPLNIQTMKETTGLLVKEITPVLHRLQEAFLVVEDQYNGEWDRGWELFARMYPELDTVKYSRHEALLIILKRYAYRMPLFDLEMAKSYYKLPAKDIKAALAALTGSGELVDTGAGYVLSDDLTELTEPGGTENLYGVFALHRNDVLVKSNEHWLKTLYKHAHYDILQYLLVDGEFKGAVWGHFKNGPYVLEDVVVQLAGDEAAARQDEILAAIFRVNSREHSPLQRYMGEELTSNHT
ncbi:hypothetical protein [Paenibacillus tengchongensis]|uniref:hypothetical protein n=1 Tax=Paenibacillus tengchongensis TaxID=2608684 RepID=UPI00124D161C|nr:hypothetical protein [Paenibacillus tengchongensis]